MISKCTPTEMYAAVGIALSYWEHAQDELLGLYRVLVEDDAPELIPRYIKRPRAKRSEMMAEAIEKWPGIFEGDELAQTVQAATELDNLATLRNQIAHGHCTNTKHESDGVIVMEGVFLVPAWNETGPMERDIRYALTLEDIKKFETDVREARWAIIGVHSTTRVRRMNANNARRMAHSGG